MDLSALKTDIIKEKEGIWVRYLDSDVKFKIARFGHLKYEKQVRNILKPHKKAVRRGNLNDQEIFRLIIPAICTHILIDWKNLLDNGKEYKYSVDNAIKLLSNPEFRDVYEFIIDIAGEGENYRKEFMEQAEKN